MSRKPRPFSALTPLPPRFGSNWPKVTLFGDSITRRCFEAEAGCWGSLLSDKLGDYFDLDRRGFSGYNSRWALELAPKLFPRQYLQSVQLFIMLFGHNDSWDSDNPLHVPVDEYESNMGSIVDYLLKEGLSRDQIILITPHWYDARAMQHYIKTMACPNFGKSFEQAAKYQQALVRVAAERQVELVDAFEFSHKHQPLGELFCDGLHLSLTGAKLLMSHLWPVVERKLSHAFAKPVAELYHAAPWDSMPAVEQWFASAATLAPKTSSD